MKYTLVLLAMILLAPVTVATAQETVNAVSNAPGNEKHIPKEPHDDDRHDEHKDQPGDGDHAEHDEHDGHQEEETADAELSDAQRRLAGIETLVVQRQTIAETITAPGEIIFNAYRTTKVTPRVQAQVIARHVRLGDRVKTGQTLVTLSSVAMAEAQGALLEAKVELARVTQLGSKVVSDKRFVSAQIAYQQAIAKVRAFGMTAEQVAAIVKSGDADNATGEFSLLSLQDGTVIKDAFVIGEIVEPGSVLLEISDESLLWVEARLTPEEANDVAIGASAQVLAGDQWLPGTVTQARHALDESTRTLAVHIEVANQQDMLHPGQFVSAVISRRAGSAGFLVPLEAVMRSADGDWQIFIEAQAGRFVPQEVDVLRSVGNHLVIEGVAEGARIVSKGAFFVQSEIAKGGFSVHNH